MKFDGKVCVITGAGSGIGRAMAVAFAREGARVLVADMALEEARDTAAGVRSAGGEAEAVAVDVSRAEDVQAMVVAAIEHFGGIDILCNNAGTGVGGKVHETSEADWERTFSLNTLGCFLGCKYTIPVMLRHGGGVIINIASVAGLVGMRDRAAYCASTAAVVGLTRAMAADYGRDNIRVNAICPGMVDTPRVASMNRDAPDSEPVGRQMHAGQPIGRTGTPGEIAAAALYLASPEAGFVHGSAFVIDGGWTAE